jgi:hypothetical protein
VAKLPDAYIGKRLFVGEGRPIALGIGPAEIRGSGYLEGPVIMGNATAFPNVWATTMIAPVTNTDLLGPPLIPGTLCTGIHNPYSLAVQGSSAFLGHIDTNSGITVGTNLIAQGEVASRCGLHVLSAKKNFDIPHPSRKGWRLRHTCPEAPTNDVYIRGKVKNRTTIDLPSYWKDFVYKESITVSLTPIGAHQDIIVKRIDDERVHLQAKTGIPINCYYHIFAERKDGESLIPEYEGKTPADYPGDNNQYSISGYHYDVKE